MNIQLYWVSALTYAIVLAVILLNDISFRKEPTQVERAFRLMTSWIIFFCLQDTLWGLCEAKVITSDRVFFFSSSLFHISTVVSTFFWLYYVLVYLGQKLQWRKVFLWADSVIILFEVILVIANYFTPTLFSIQKGLYVTEPFRTFTFLNQYIVYLATGLIVLLLSFKATSEKNITRRHNYQVVFAASLAPILLGIFQLLYPDGPFYSLGYFLACFITHIFVVAKEREEREEKEISYKTNYDAQTKLYNRRSYELQMDELEAKGVEADTIFVSMDLNGLKVANDTAGHAAGDELLEGAAMCMKRVLGRYGKIYRTGGDEFCAILHIHSEKIDNIMKILAKEVAQWKGQMVDELSISCGYTSQNEAAKIGQPKDLASLADKRMYEDKARHYKQRGIDRRGHQSAYTALCRLYTKILKINLTNDTYHIVDMDIEEKDVSMGYDERISVWLRNFGESGMVHPDDKESYLSHTARPFMQEFFASGKNTLCIFYRRKFKDSHKQVMMEMVRADDYQDDNQSLFLYVKDIDQKN